MYDLRGRSSGQKSLMGEELVPARAVKLQKKEGSSEMHGMWKSQNVVTIISGETGAQEESTKMPRFEGPSRASPTLDSLDMWGAPGTPKWKCECREGKEPK